MLFYFFPAVQKATAETFRAAGLAHALDGELGIASRQVFDRGPDGGPGCVAALAGSDDGLGYHGDRQRWRKIPASPSPAWVGVPSEPPTLPEQLARRRLVPGHAVELADGRPWIVPIARRWDDGEGGWYRALPARSRLDENGQWQSGDVLETYRDLWETASAWDESLANAVQKKTADGRVSARFDFPGLHAAALKVLAVNYRLGPAEADLLGLLTENHCIEILHAAIDVPTRIAWFAQKKTAADPAGTSSPAGPAV